MIHCDQCQELLSDSRDRCWRCGFAPSDQCALRVFRAPPLSWLRRGPHWLIAAVLLLLIWGMLALAGLTLADLWTDTVYIAVGVALMTPGALRRGQAKQLALLTLVGGLVPSVSSWLIQLVVPSRMPIAWTMIWPVFVVVAAGMADWYFARSGDLYSLSWMVLTCTVAGATVAIPFGILWYSSWAGRWNISTAVILLVLVTWLAVPLGHRLSCAARRRQRYLFFSLAPLAVVTYALMLHSGFFWLGRASLLGHGPFSHWTAAGIVASRGHTSDYTFLLDRLQRADWSQPTEYPVGRYEDWRSAAVVLLIRHDEPWAAEELSKLYAAHPSEALLDMTRGLFVDQKRYETVPITIRYALVESMNVSEFATVGQRRHKEALTKLRVPQVARAWMYDAMYNNILVELLHARAERRWANLTHEEMNVDDARRKVLADLLNEDAGSVLLDWFAVYETQIDQVPTPLTAELHAETSRVVAAFDRYHAAMTRWRNWSVGAETDPSTPRPREPDWDIPTTAGLEREAARYVDEVNLRTKSP